MNEKTADRAQRHRPANHDQAPIPKLVHSLFDVLEIVFCSLHEVLKFFLPTIVHLYQPTIGNQTLKLRELPFFPSLLAHAWFTPQYLKLVVVTYFGQIDFQATPVSNQTPWPKRDEVAFPVFVPPGSAFVSITGFPAAAVGSATVKAAAVPAPEKAIWPSIPSHPPIRYQMKAEVLTEELLDKVAVYD